MDSVSQKIPNREPSTTFPRQKAVANPGLTCDVSLSSNKDRLPILWIYSV